MKSWVVDVIVWSFMIGALLVGWSVIHCTAPVNINVKAEVWQCETEIRNNDGSVNFRGCQKTDGDEPVEQKAVDGTDDFQGSLLRAQDARLN